MFHKQGNKMKLRNNNNTNNTIPTFLVADTQLYKRLCWSVSLSVCPLVMN